MIWRKEEDITKSHILAGHSITPNYLATKKNNFSKKYSFSNKPSICIKKNKNTELSDLKRIDRLTLKKEIQDFENSLESFVRDLSEKRRKQNLLREIEPKTNLNVDENIISLDHIFKSNENNREEKGSDNQIIRDIYKWKSHKNGNVSEKKRNVKQKSAPKRKLTKSANSKLASFEGELHGNYNKKLDMVKNFITLVNNNKKHDSVLRNDGISQRDERSNKHLPTSPGLSSKVHLTRDEIMRKYALQYKDKRNRYFRYGAFISRAPRLEAILEQPDKEAEEEKYYD